MSGSQGYPNDFFKTNRFFYRMAGIWLYNPQIVPKLRRVMQLTWTFSLCALSLCFECMEYMIFRETIHDINKLISQLGILLTRYVGLVKMAVILTQHRRLVQIEEDLQNETFRYHGFGDFNPAKMMTEAKTFCSKFSVTIYWLYTMIAILSFFTTIAHLEYDNKEEVIKGKTCYDYLPFIYYIPFDETTKTGCKYATAWLTYNIAVFAIFICCHDALYFAMIHCLKTQFVILCGAIRTMRERVLLRMKLPPTFTVLHDESYPELEEEMYNEMKFVSKHFSLLIRVTAELEKAFTYQTFFQTLITLIMTASCLFVMSSVPVNSVIFYTQAEYCICIVTSATIFYWSGTSIITSSDDISQAFYDTNWLSGSVRFKRAILINMARIQTPLCLTIGKFVPMTLSVSVAVFKASFSYYALFKSVEEEA